jgi:glycosyltransferase involved in cell wall biosynthesis
LTLFQAKDKKKLDDIILNKNKNSRQLKIKYYPVLYHGPDIFHLQWAKSIADWIWVQEFGIKLIVGLRGAHINYSPIADEELANTYKTLFPNVDGFHAVSKAISEEAIKYKAVKSKIHLVYSGLDLDKMQFQLKKFDVSKPLAIISVGRAHWKKGYSYALDAMNLLEKDNIDFKYTVVGVENDEELLYKRSQSKLEKKITFKGTLSFTEIVTEIRNADVLLLSSVEEGIANVVLESMALGTLVISTNCGGMNEVIIDSKNGFLVPIRDHESMANALKKVSELPLSTYQKITKAARVTIEKQHSYEKMISGMQVLYQKVLKNKL